MFALDASVAASWAFADETHPAAEAALNRIAEEGAVAPQLLRYELRNVLLTGERRGRLTAAGTVRFLGYFSNLPIAFDFAADDAAVLALARAHKLTVYDAVYLELAMRKSLPLATLDSALAAAAKAEKVRLIG
jgi:predicted nucleic acid-binding protein